MAVIGFSLDRHIISLCQIVCDLVDLHGPIRFSYIAHLILVDIDFLVLSCGLSLLKIPSDLSPSPHIQSFHYF